jgi:ribosomal protein S18 acetylase RimI-like enzyme
MTDITERSDRDPDPHAIRPARSEDVGAIHQLVAAAYDPLVERLGVPSWPQQFDYLREVQAGTVWVLEWRSRIVGMLQLVNAHHGLSVEGVTVLPDCQRQGFGRVLIGFAETEAHKRGRDRLMLFTHERMSDALAFYRRLGFIEIRRVANKGHTWVRLDKDIGANAKSSLPPDVTAPRPSTVSAPRRRGPRPRG